MAFLTTLGPGYDLHHAPPVDVRPDVFADLSDTVPGLVVDLLNRVIPGTLAPRRVVFKAPSTLIVEDLLLNDPEGKGVLKIARVEGKLRMSALLAGNLVVERLKVTGPKFLLKSKDGELNLLRALVAERKPSADPPPDVEIHFENVSVEAGSLVYTDLDNVTVNASGLRGTGSASFYIKQGSVLVSVNQAHVGRGVVKLADLDIDYNDIDVSARIANKTIIIQNAKGKLLGAPFSGGGSITIAPDPRLKLRGRASVPAGTWPGRFPPPAFDLPDIEVEDVRITGTLKAPLLHTDGRFGPFVFLDYPVDDGAFQVTTTLKDTVISQASVRMLGGRVTVAQGSTIVFQDLQSRLDVGFSDLTMRGLENGALKPPSKGRVSGRADLTGPLDLKTPLAAAVTFRTQDLVIADTHLQGRTTGNARVDIEKERVRLYAVHVAGSAIDADVDGTVWLKKKRLALNVVGSSSKPRALRPDIPEALRLGRTRFSGRVEGPFAKPVVTGQAEVVDLDAYGVPVQNIVADIAVDTEHVRIVQGAGVVAGGPASASGTVNLGKNGSLALTFRATRAELSDIDQLKDDVAGRVSLTGTVSGTTTTPRVVSDVVARNLSVSGEPVGDLSARASLRGGEVVIEALRVRGKIADAESKRVTYRLDDETLRGRVDVTRVDFAQVQALQDAALTGTATGRVELGGTRTALQVDGAFAVRNLVAKEVALGDGPARVWLRPDLANGENSYTVQAAVTLAQYDARAEVRAAYRTKTKRLNSSVRLEHVDVSRYIPADDTRWPGVSAFVGGVVQVQGEIDALNYKADLSAPNVTFGPREFGPLRAVDEGRSIAAEVAAHRSMGAMHLNASLREGTLEAVLCAFPDDAAAGDGSRRVSPCPDNPSVWAFVEGPLAVDTFAFSLDVEAAVRDQAFESLVPALRDAELALGADAMMHFKLKRDDAGKLRYDGLANIEAMRIEAPGAPAVVLAEPVGIAVEHYDVHLEAPARFVVGEKAVTLSGHYHTERETLGANVEGEVALSVIRLFTDQVSAARGTVSARALVNGPLDRLRFDACIRPQSGAQLSPRALGREVTFRGGEICLRTEDEGDDRHVFSAKGFRAEIGEGGVSVEGEAWLRELVSGDGLPQVERWNLSALGDSLEFKSGRNRVMVGFDLELMGDKDRPTLRGRIDVDEGEVRENFELKNFVLTKAPSAPSEPLAVQLSPYSLEHLHFDIALSVQDFRARADVSTIRLDTTLRGDLRLTDSVRLPQLTGLLDVSEGYFIFPHATFEVEQTEIEFPPQPDGKFRPNIFVQARADLEPPKNGLETEVGCVLSIDGNIEQMRLSLETEDAEHQFDESTILRFVLFGTPLSSGVNFQNGEAALRAVSTEVTAVLTRELEDSIREQFGTQVQFNLFYEEGQVKGGVRYQLGERIKFEGETGVAVAGEAAQSGAGGSNARLRLLLIDHFPSFWLGQDVAFEGEINSGTGTQSSQASSDLRLSYRLFEF